MHWHAAGSAARAASPPSGETTGDEDSLVEGQTKPWWHTSFEEKAAIVGAFGGITFGYDIGVISGALVSLMQDFALTPTAEGGCFRGHTSSLPRTCLRPSGVRAVVGFTRHGGGNDRDRADPGRAVGRLRD